jgi:hypothetical protein
MWLGLDDLPKRSPEIIEALVANVFWVVGPSAQPKSSALFCSEEKPIMLSRMDDRRFDRDIALQQDPDRARDRLLIFASDARTIMR